ncbi:MAG: WG repeat-containing protein [Clostridia bacterium]|nr:WG repeat-containing protein [Clostridia bacterium]
MNLIDESYSKSGDTRKIMIAGIVGIVLLLIIIIALLVVVVMVNSNSLGITINNKKYNASQILYETPENGMYIKIEDLSNAIGYSYKSGGLTDEDENKCYVTNQNIEESTFFEVDSKEIYKVMGDTGETEYYTLDNPIIKVDGKIYMPINSVDVAMNAVLTTNKRKYSIASIESIESRYNNSSDKTLVMNDSIVWNTNYLSNKKLLKKQLVIITDGNERLGIAKVGIEQSKGTGKNKKSKISTVTTSAIIDPKYTDIKYVEKYNQLIVESNGKKGIIQLYDNNGEIDKETIVSLQYEDIKPISQNLFLISQADSTSTSSSEKNEKYGILDTSNNSEDIILPIEYDQIGIDISTFPNNGLNNEYVIYDTLIPVRKGELWGFVNLKGKIIVKLEYSDFGCVGKNTNNNVLLVPDIEGIVVKKDNKYGIISKTNRTLIKTELTRVYKSVVDNTMQYTMVYGGKEYNIVDYIKNPSKYDSNSNSKTKNTTINTTNNTTKQNTTNTTNTNTTNTTN